MFAGFGESWKVMPQKNLKYCLIFSLSGVLLVLMCIGGLAGRNFEHGEGQWCALVEDAQNRKAAEEYAREFGWGAWGDIEVEAQTITAAQIPAGESEARLVARLRAEFEKDADLAASIIRRLSSASIYERLSRNPSDDASLGILKEIELETGASLKRQAEVLGVLRKYAKSASEESAGEYSSCIVLLERLTAIFARIRAYTDIVREKSGDPDYKSVISARYAAMSGEFNRLYNEISKKRKQVHGETR